MKAAVRVELAGGGYVALETSTISRDFELVAGLLDVVVQFDVDEARARAAASM